MLPEQGSFCVEIPPHFSSPRENAGYAFFVKKSENGDSRNTSMAVISRSLKWQTIDKCMLSGQESFLRGDRTFFAKKSRRSGGVARFPEESGRTISVV